MPKLFRHFSGIAPVCTICVNFGIMLAWPSSTLNLFKSKNTTLQRPMTETELALFGSLSSVTALVSTPLSGFLLDIVGRKYSSILFSLPQVLSWSLVLISNRVDIVLVAACLSGFGASFFIICPIYIGEICQANIRGTLTACFNIMYGVGILLSYVLGGYLSYYGMIYTSLTLSTSGVLLMMFLKESPTYLMEKGLHKNAAEVVAFYRGTRIDSKEVEEELIIINKSLHPELDDESPEEEKLNATSTSRKKLSPIKFLKKSKSTRKAFAVIFALYTFTMFQGVIIVQVYAEPLFEKALPGVSGTVTSIVFAMFNIISGIVAGHLTDVFGRRPLMIYCSLVTGVFCVLLGSQIELRWGPNWLTAVFLYAYCVFYTAGAGTIPYVAIGEFFLPEIRSFLSTIALEWAWICNFILLLVFNHLVEVLGLGSIFYIFGVVCFISALYCHFYLPETKGLTVDVIQQLFLT